MKGMETSRYLSRNSASSFKLYLSGIISNNLLKQKANIIARISWRWSAFLYSTELPHDGSSNNSSDVI